MATSLSATTPSSSFDSLIKFGDNDGAISTFKQLSDGSGNNLPIYISTTSVSLTGSIQGSSTNSATASLAFSASQAVTASYIQNAQTASYALNATSASYSNNSTSASYSNNSTSASYASGSISACFQTVLSRPVVLDQICSVVVVAMVLVVLSSHHPVILGRSFYIPL